MSNASLELARKIVGHMPGWRAEQRHDMDHCAYIVNKDDGRELWLTVGRWEKRGRAEVHSSYPAGYTQVSLNVLDFQTTANVDRNPEQIAKQIMRKVAEPMIPELERIRAALKQRDDDEAARRTATAEMRSQCPELRDGFGKKDLRWSPASDGYGDFQPCHDGSRWRIDISSVPHRVALQIVRILAAYNAAETAKGKAAT